MKKLIFNNSIAYTKGWYKHSSDDIEDMWKDLVYCICADGWSIYTKREVASWCLNRIEEYDEAIKKERGCWGVRDFYGFMERNRELYRFYNNNNNELSDAANIIWIWYALMQSLSNDLFEEFYLPSREVLPISLDSSRIDKNSGWQPGELYSERMKYIKDKYPYFKEQELYSFIKYYKPEISNHNF